MPHFVDPTVPAVQVLHGTFGIVTMLAALTQIFPGMRGRFPRQYAKHRQFMFSSVALALVIPMSAALFQGGLHWLPFVNPMVITTCSSGCRGWCTSTSRTGS